MSDLLIWQQMTKEVTPNFQTAAGVSPARRTSRDRLDIISGILP